MNKDPIAFIKQTAQIVHETYHNNKDWNKCPDPICVSTRMWIKNFQKDEKIWVTADHKILLIKGMEDSHLYNSYNFVKRKMGVVVAKAKQMGLNDTKAKDIVENEFPVLNDLKAEIIRREAAKSAQYEGTRNLDI